jgi:hypothetical protein
MKWIEQLKLILEKVVVPEYDFIDHVKIKEYGSYDYRFYEIHYMIKRGREGDADKWIIREIMDETGNLVKLLGNEDNIDYSVYLSKMENPHR